MLKQFQKIGKLLFAEGLVGVFEGTIVFRDESKVFITKKQAILSDLQAEDVLELDLKDSKLEEVYKEIFNKTGAKAIIQARPVSAIAVSLTDNKIVPQDSIGMSKIKSAPIVRVRENELAGMLPNFLGNKVAVVKGLGSFAIGEDLETALFYTSTVEKSCKILIAIRSTNNKSQQKEHRRDPRKHSTGIPPGIGVMDRSRGQNRYGRLR